jgi:hypothetical protein
VDAILKAGAKDKITNKTVALMTPQEAESLNTTAGKIILKQAKKGLRVQAFKVVGNYCTNKFACPTHISVMIHVKVEVKPDLTFTGAAGLTVGDWVEVEHDFSSGLNFRGGVGIITGIVEKFSNVKYILRYAFGVSKETFRRWMGEGHEFVKRVPFNKGKNVIDDPKMVATYIIL